MSKRFLFTLALLLAPLAPALAQTPPQTYFVNNTIPCQDAAGNGTAERPYCTLRYVSTIARPGDTFLIGAPGATDYRDGSGPNAFLKPGTATAPITYRAVGKVTISAHVDVPDEQFVLTDLPNVWALAGAPVGNKVWQTHYDPILVDDPNNSRFTMVDTDGPLSLSAAPDEATLIAQEGMYSRNATTGVLRVHPYGNRTPGKGTTDFVVGIGQSLNVDSKAAWNVFDGFRVTYTGSAYSAQVFGANPKLLNMRYIGQPLSMRGANSYSENIEITHVIERMADGDWLWHWRGSGSAGGFYGTNHYMRNLHVWHSWNSSFGSESATNVTVDGAILHGAPNHCSVAGNGNSKISNVIMFNCQDLQWVHDTASMTFEHVTIPSGIGISANRRTLGPLIIRNSIFSGTVHFVRGDGVAATLPLKGCSWEKGSVIENSVVSTGAFIERCSTQKEIPIRTYQAMCEAGQLVGADGLPDCVTIRNLVYFSDWSTIVKQLRIPNTDTWDATLAVGSPAIDLGMPTTVATDLLRVARPQGAAPDAGAYEAVEKPKPVDCVVSDWSPWTATGPWTFANWSQSRTEDRSRTITTPPANGGAACPVDLTETRTMTEACATVGAL